MVMIMVLFRVHFLEYTPEINQLQLHNMLYLLLHSPSTSPRNHRGHPHAHPSMASHASSSSISLASTHPREIPLQRSQSIASLASLGSFNSSRPSTSSKANVQTGKGMANFWSWRS